MKVLRLLVQLVCTGAIVVIGIYAGIAACIVFFILTGSLEPGGVMFYDSRTPTLGSALAFSLAGFAAVAAIGFVRNKLMQHHGAAV